VTSASRPLWQIAQIADLRARSDPGRPPGHFACSGPVSPKRRRLAAAAPRPPLRVGSDPVSDRDELLNVIKERAVVRGPVTLSSGQRADWYVDLRRVLLDGSAAPLAGRVMLATTADLSYDAVGGLTLGADPVATAMMHAA